MSTDLTMRETGESFQNSESSITRDSPYMDGTFGLLQLADLAEKLGTELLQKKLASWPPVFLKAASTSPASASLSAANPLCSMLPSAAKLFRPALCPSRLCRP